MNHFPGVGPYQNPLPGQMPRALRGEAVANLFRQWCDAFSRRDKPAAANAANALLMTLNQNGVPEVEINALFTSVKNAVEALDTSCGSTSSGFTGGMPTSSGIDFYEPDPDRFYVLDKRSGTELGGVLEDLRFMDNYLVRGAPAPNRMLFVGEPGNGKTVGALWLGSQLEMLVALIRIDGVLGPLVGEPARRLRLCFEEAQDRKAIIVIDEFEAVAVDRANSSPNMGQWAKETTSALLQLLDSLDPEQIVIGATNIPDDIDKAVMRRMRKHVVFYPPDRDARAAMLKHWWARAPHHPKAKKELLDKTEGKSGDFLERMAHEANRIAARRGATEPITVLDIERALRSVLPQHGGFRQELSSGAWQESSAAQGPQPLRGDDAKTECVPSQPRRDQQSSAVQGSHHVTSSNTKTETVPSPTPLFEKSTTENLP